MKTAAKFSLVLVTAPDLKNAQSLAHLALDARLVACANLIPQTESHYWWQGKIETSRETLILFKTLKAHLPALEKLVRKNHPYEVPEFLVLPLSQGSPAYLQWLADAVTPAISPNKE